MLSRSNAPKNTSECQDAWDQVNSAADDVVSAANRLIRCVEGSNHNDDCYSEARRVDPITAIMSLQFPSSSYCD